MTSSTFFFVFIPLLAIILLAVNLIFAPHNPYQEKDSAFECGFHSFLGQNRTKFSIYFFIFALIFLLFDLEILLVYPYVVSAHTNGIYGLVIMLIFFLALTLGFAFELGKNALKIDSRQMVTLNKETVSITASVSGIHIRSSIKKVNRSRMYIFVWYEDVTEESLGRKVKTVRRKFTKKYLQAVRAEGNWIHTSRGKYFDGSGGAAVSCLGHTNEEVAQAMSVVINDGLTYLSSAIFLTNHAELLAKELLAGTNNQMAAVYPTGSGSEAVEAMVKTVLDYHYTLDRNTKRCKFISRMPSYHGTTSGALALTQMGSRKKPYLPWLNDKVYTVSSCHPYHQLLDGESNEAFVARKKAELDAKFIELGPETVAGFIAEPVVGAAMGAVPFVPGYLKAMQEVCHKHGALFMDDEVMCGMGRTGYLHAWQAEKDFVPDIQAVAKGLGGGFISVAAVFWSPKIVDVLEKNDSKGFNHAQTFQSSPLQAAAALTVQQIIRREGLVENAAKMGADLMRKLKLALDDHPHVGNIRGMGLFIGIEFVANKSTKEPFDHRLNLAYKLTTLALSKPYSISLYPGSGGVDGVRGDHFIISPPYNINEKDVDYIVDKVSLLINKAFSQATYLEIMRAYLNKHSNIFSNKIKTFIWGLKKGIKSVFLKLQNRFRGSGK